MKTQLQQLFFLSVFCFLCTVFVFFVPWGSSSNDEGEVSQSESNIAVEEAAPVQEVVKFSGTLRIAIKEGKVKKELSDFAAKFESVHGGKVEFTQISSPSDWVGIDGYDLYLFPYDQLTGVQFGTINFQEDVSSLFIPQLKDFVEKHRSIIPFGIDLPVSYGMNEIGEGIDGLVIASQNWKPARPVGPFNFGISDNEATYDNSLIASHQIVDFIKVNDIGAFNQWIDFSTSSQELQQGLLYSVQGNSDLCKKHPLNCLLEKNLLGVAWGFASDYDYEFEDMFLTTKYPYDGESQFVRLYALALDANTENSSIALQFILDYMDYAFAEDTTSLSKALGLVPVFQNEFTRNCYQDACGLESKLTILEDGFALINRFFKDSVFWKVVSKKIQPNLYLVNTLL